jgi:acid phosphatase
VPPERSGPVSALFTYTNTLTGKNNIVNPFKPLLSILVACMLCAPLPAQQQSINGKAVFPRERVPNLGKVKQLLKAYHDCRCRCGCYVTEMNEQGRRAVAFLERRSATRTSGEKLAIVLDIDDTALSDYPFYETTDLGYIPSLFEQWAQSAQAPAIESTLRVFQMARQLQVAVFFVSGRRESLRAATEQNLQTRGFVGWSRLVLESTHDNSRSVAEFKSLARQHITDEGYRIILNMGDQVSDLSGEPAAELSVKLPNPFYFIP